MVGGGGVFDAVVQGAEDVYVEVILVPGGGGGGTA
jgi:hypothetical protein